MASTSETGHAKNVANFQNLIEFITGYGATYNPSKNSLQLPQLTALKAAAEVYGASSPQFAQVKGIEFSKLKL